MSDANLTEESATTIGDDPWWGAPGLAVELKIPVTQAEYLIRRGYIRTRKIGGLRVGSRRQLRAQIYGPDEPPDPPRSSSSTRRRRRRMAALGEGGAR
jgi:hypothetical protein